jgi:hypothetical protein
MAQGGSKWMKIKVDAATGACEVKDNSDVEPAEMGQTELEQISQSNGFTHVGTILHSHSSPGCVWFVMGGRIFVVCT